MYNLKQKRKTIRPHQQQQISGGLLVDLASAKKLTCLNKIIDEQVE